jgi:hypothetical protein
VDLNAACRPKRTKTYWYLCTFKCPLKKTQPSCPCSRDLNWTSKGLTQLFLIKHVKNFHVYYCYTIYFHSKNDTYLTTAAVQNFFNETIVFSSSQILGLLSIYYAMHPCSLFNLLVHCLLFHSVRFILRALQSLKMLVPVHQSTQHNFQEYFISETPL